MNLYTSIPMAIETVLADLIKEQEVGATVRFRCWHNIRGDYRWRPDIDRVTPVIDIRVSPPAVDQSQVAYTCTALITCVSLADDDLDHTQIIAMEDAVQATLDAVQCAFNEQGMAWQGLQNKLREQYEHMYWAGITQQEPMAPTDGDGLNMVAFTVELHLCRQLNKGVQDGR